MKRASIASLGIAFALVFPARASAQACDFIVDMSAECVVVAGLVRPESAQPHDETGWYVSNMGTALGNGFITRIGHDGCVTLRWFQGLDFPKGIDIFEDTLYVSSSQRVVAIDLATATKAEEFTAPAGKVFSWNDISIDRRRKDLYVSDWGFTSSITGIWKIALETGDMEKIEGFVGSDGLPTARPNGLLVDKDHILALTNGTIWRRNLETGATSEINLGLGGMDGIERVAHRTYVATEIQNQNVWLVTLDGDGAHFEKTFLATGSFWADLGYDPVSELVALPGIVTNQLLFRRLVLGRRALASCDG